MERYLGKAEPSQRGSLTPLHSQSTRTWSSPGEVGTCFRSFLLPWRQLLRGVTAQWPMWQHGMCWIVLQWVGSLWAAGLVSQGRGSTSARVRVAAALPWSCRRRITPPLRRWRGAQGISWRSLETVEMSTGAKVADGAVDWQDVTGRAWGGVKRNKGNTQNKPQLHLRNSAFYFLLNQW